MVDDINQLITLTCYGCKRPLAQLYMCELDDLCCLSIRCSVCMLKNVDWKQSTRTASQERAQIWANIVKMNNKSVK
jgi:hypothetical protein